MKKLTLLFKKKQIKKTIELGGCHEGNFGGYGLDFVFILNYLGWGERKKEEPQKLFSA